jgi:hypothetical protein
VDDGLRTERPALPLREAAVRLGLTVEALRLRLEQGRARGFHRDGETFVYLNDSAAEHRFGGAVADRPPDDGDAPVGGDSLPIVVEFQRLELTRLLKENERLNARLDQLMDEIRHLRDMQQREQVLRQQDQSLRRQIQDTLDHLTQRLALPPPDKTPAKAPAEHPPSVRAPHPVDNRPELVLTRMAPAAAPAGAKPGAGGRGNGQVPPGPAYLVARGDADRREPRAAMPKAEPGGQPPQVLTAAPPTAGDNAIAPEEAAELAGILKDIGLSLRDSEAFRRYPPVAPGAAPPRAGERRAVDPVLRATIKPPPPAAAPRPAAPVEAREAREALAVDEVALLAILDAMGPSAEDRRNAARRMRQILRGRPPTRPRQS